MKRLSLILRIPIYAAGAVLWIAGVALVIVADALGGEDHARHLIP